MINSTRPHLWRPDITASTLSYNRWFFGTGPQAYQEQRQRFSVEFERVLQRTDQLTMLSADRLRTHPGMLATLRMCTAPVLARERLVAFADTIRPCVTALEQGRLPARMSGSEIQGHLTRICDVVTTLLDPDLFCWVSAHREPTSGERAHAAVVVADRRCDALSDLIIRQAGKERQHTEVAAWLVGRGYQQRPCITTRDIRTFEPGTFTLEQLVAVGHRTGPELLVDVVAQPLNAAKGALPILIQAATHTDSRPGRRSSDAAWSRLLRDNYGPELQLLLLIGGTVDTGFLRDRAAEGLDWLWEHRLDDLALAGL